MVDYGKLREILKRAKKSGIKRGGAKRTWVCLEGCLLQRQTGGRVGRGAGRSGWRGGGGRRWGRTSRRGERKRREGRGAGRRRRG